MRGVVDHQVAVDHAPAGVDAGRDRPQDDGADGHRRHEVPVAAVEVEHAAARLEQVVDLLAEPPEVGGVERGLDLDAAADPVAPPHAAIVVG